VRYASLSALACTEAASPGRAPSRFQRDEQVVELRLEKLAAGTVAMVHDVTAEVRHQVKLQRDREALLHEERMHAMGVLASGMAHDLNHVLNVMALRVATLRADQTLGGARGCRACGPRCAPNNRGGPRAARSTASRAWWEMARASSRDFKIWRASGAIGPTIRSTSPPS
jgi:signal transduction histidine kinase